MAILNLNLVIKLIDQATAPVRRLGQLVSGLQRPFRAAQMAAGGLLRDLRLIAMAGAAVGAVLGVALYRSVRRYADVGDAALETAQKVGISVPAFMRWTYAAKKGGVEAASLEDALKFLNLSSVAAAEGAKQDARAFDQLGVAYKDAHGKIVPMEQLLPKVADAFQKMEDGPRKTAIAVALFGRSGVAMIPMLNEGAAGLKKWGDEAERIGVVMSDEAAAQADEFNDSLDTLNQSVFGLGNGIAGGLLPQLTQLIQMLTAMIAANRPEILQRLQGIFAQLGESLPGVIKGIGDFAQLLGDIAAALGPMIQAVGGFNTVLDLLAVLMITRVALAIWTAVAAVWGLNGAMLANPIGIVIVLLAGLAMVVYGVFRSWKPITAFFKGVWVVLKAVFKVGIAALVQAILNFSPLGLIIRNWSGIAGFFSRMWGGVKSAFVAGVAAVWNILPAWFRQVLRGAAFVLKVAGNIGGGPSNDDAPPPPRGPRPDVGGGGGGRQFGGRIDVHAFSDGRAPRVETQSYTPDFGLASVGGVTTRGR